MDPNKITITMNRREAFALVDALNCFSDCSEGNLAQVLEVWVPDEESEHYLKIQGDLGQDVAERIRHEITCSIRCDEKFQQLLHDMKMDAKGRH